MNPKHTVLQAASFLAAIALLPTTAADDPPMFVRQPRSVMVPVGETMHLSCVVTGTPPIALIWQRDGVFLSDQTNATLTITNAEAAHSGRYRLFAVNEDGMARSTNAAVVVYTNQPCNFPWAWEAKLRGPKPPGFASLVSGMALDGAGNIFVSGDAATVDSGGDFLTAKYAPDGKLFWTASFDEPGNQNQSARALAVDSQGACYVTGYEYALKADWDNDYLTIKYSPEGRALWTNRWDAAPGSEDLAYAIAVDETGHSYILGTGGLIKLSPQGSLLWANRLVQGQFSMLGLAAGRVYAAIPWGGSWRSGLYCLDTDGAVLWQAGYGSERSRSIRDMTTDGSGCVYVAAATNCNWELNTGDIEVTKFDGTGSNVWTTVYDGPFGRADDAGALAVDWAGAVVVTGCTWHTNRARTDAYDRGPDDVLTLKLNADGSLAWAATYRGPEGLGEGGSRIAVDDEGSIYVAGGANFSTPQGSEAIPRLLKYDQAGNLLWASTYRSHPKFTQGSAYAHLALGKPGQVVVGGYSSYLSGQNPRLEFLLVSYDELTPRLARAGVPAPGVRQGCLVSPRHSVFDILASADLAAGAWQTISTVTNHNGLAPFFDPAVGQHPFRFYRAKETTP